jgi:Subtilase family/Bacterial pre-peptidase C-terminal domain/RTX calcium-binding nonapeptide repeat (4 copies)
MILLQDNTIFGDEIANLLVGTTAQDTIFGGLGTDSIVGGGAADVLYGNADADFLYGNADADTLYGSLADDFIFGGKGNDLIFGGKGNDRIFGDRGNDTIYGDRGADSLTGGLGADAFAIGPGTGGLSLSEADVILDFARGEDSIQLIGGLIGEDLNAIADAGNTIIQHKTTGEIFAVVQGIDLATPPPSNLPDPAIVKNAPVETIDPPIPIPGVGTGTERPVTEDPGNTVEAALDIAGSSNGLIYRQQVSQSDPDDFYAFSVGASDTLILSLTGLNHNADLFLLDSEGNVIQSSASAGITDEFIAQPLDTGSYVIQVKAFDPEVTDYNLNVTQISNLPGITNDAPEGVAEIQTFESSQLISLDPTVSGDPPLLGRAFRNDPRFAGIDGRGFSTVILDTGIDLNHPFFGPDNNGDGISDRIVYSRDFADNDAYASDGNGHGSHVSSIVAGSSWNGRPEPQFITYQGMAPGANIIHLKVGIGDTRSISQIAVERALKWVMDNADRYNIASVNMSFGDWNYSIPNIPSLIVYGISDELADLKAKNVIVVSGAGNGFAEGGSVPGVSWPAAEPDSLAVGATWDGNVGPQSFKSGAIDYSTGAYRITSFSQRDPNLTDIFAPGGDILGANFDGGTIKQSGTSQASPHIAGIAVLAQQLAVQTLGRRLTFDEFRDAMRNSADPIYDGDDENDNVTNTGVSYPHVNVLRLGEYILNFAGVGTPAPPPPPALSKYGFLYNYDPGNSRTEYYSGYTYAPPGSLKVGTNYNPLAAPNLRGTDGLYYIASEQPAPDTAIAGQVFVERYSAPTTRVGYENTAVPSAFSLGKPSGFKGLGSEVDFAPTKDANGKPIFSLFGADLWAANLNNERYSFGF